MKRILIVDDEPVIVDVLQRILVRLGLDPVVADSVDMAMERFSRGYFDLVLMDVLMPEKNGYEIVKEMKLLRPNQKVVLVTGLRADTAEAEANLQDVNVEDVLSKPFSFDKVRSVVTKIIERDEELNHKEVLFSQSSVENRVCGPVEGNC